ncbi:MAG: hypothetical protein K6G88_04480 [Lachnospiraceae bacterium]|nr:hypothetical protein [Lachnospiraceae bacterium]
MKEEKTKYVEPADYFPEEIRRKHKLGEFAEDEEDIESQTCTDSDDSSKKE